MPTRYTAASQSALLALLRDSQGNGDAAEAGTAPVASLLHDLEVHQIELEMQNRELRSAQQQLEESRSRYADLFDLAPVGYCTFSEDGSIQDVNLTAAAMLGVERAQLRDQAFVAMLSVPERKRFNDHLRQCFSEARSVTSELTVRASEHGELVVQIISAPVFGLAGKVTASRTTLTDITALKRSEIGLRFLVAASEALACALDYDQTLAAVVQLTVPLLADVAFIDVLDAHGVGSRPQIVFADPGRAHLGAAIKSRIPERDGDGLQAEVLRGGAPLMVTDRSAAALTTRDLGEAGPATSAMFIPLSNRGGTFGVLTLAMAESGRRHTSRELTLALELARRAAVAIDNARLYRAAQDAIRTRDAVLAVVAHDLKNPLTSIALGATTLLQTAPNTDRRSGRKQLLAIRRAAERMGRLIADLVDLSSLEAGCVSIDLQEHDVAEMLDDAFEALDPLAQAKGLRIELAIEEGARTVRCDRGRTLQVLSNLVGNAIKFMPAPGSVRVTARRLGDEICFGVTDSGPGIEPAAIPRVFDRYWQAQPGSHEGSGLGLHIAKRMVDAQGGRIWVESEPGGGTSFYVAMGIPQGR